ncbi:tail-completion protein [Vibrio phage 1.028.O._10N.286.45.B6]|nr:tail-completion protein [Vibrio phage 1.028.O._10N.286.45.B6]AUR90041.1 DNA-binding domain protein [Vibrio phage 1.136.O._10N.261.45.E11]AUR90359.1 tail-completion protein [Vibrio phage 1.142.O._10N.261.49.E11]AUR91155.1 tail-completion protein [Vibrio phage 1.156.O._10N.261.45.A6]AUR91336.1 tail-completion protein [Vibrio phage 1.159.O._10N.261.46.F12]AUR96234.1 tail-completion protein [Vibrio phage 1.217.O._10N.261.45.A1]AUR96284.1 tail-completion protein [Vibrio phage 1.219.O._10N.261.4
MSRPDFTTSGSTVWAVNEIVQYLKPKLEGGVREIEKIQTVERHIGRFDKADDIKRWMSNRDGGVRVAALRVPQYETVGNRLIGNVNLVAYVFTTDQFGYEKDLRAEVVAGKLVRELMDRSALPTSYGRVENVRSDNLYSGEIDKLGIAIWSVTWSQQWYLDEEIDLSTLDDFITFGLKGEIADGAPTIDGEVKLPQ